MDKNDNPAPSIDNPFIMPTSSQIVQQINIILKDIKLSHPLVLDSVFIEKIAPYINNFIYFPRMLYIIYDTEGNYTFKKEAYKRERFVQVLIFWIGTHYYKTLEEIDRKNSKEINSDYIEKNIKENNVNYKENKRENKVNGNKRDKKGLVAFSKLITKLYMLKYLCLDDIETLSKFILTLSLLYRKEIGPIENKVIKIEFFIRWAFTLLRLCFIDYPKRNQLSNEEVQMLIDFIDYFKSTFVSEDNMIYFCNRSNSSYTFFNLIYFLKLTDSKELKMSILNLFSSIYMYRFNQPKCYAPMIYQLQNCLVNFDQKEKEEIKKDIDLLNFPIMFLQNQFEQESVQSKQDQLILDNAFYFNHKYCGILCSSLQLMKEEKTYIFSFKLVPNNEQNEEYSLLSLHEVTSSNHISQLLKFSLEKNDDVLLNKPGKNPQIVTKHQLSEAQLKDKEREKKDHSLYKMYLTIKTEKKDLDIYIIPNKTYLFVIEQTYKTMTITYSHHIKNNIVRNDTEIINVNTSKYDTSLVCLIGCEFIEPLPSKIVDETLLETESAFSGYMGAVIIIEKGQTKEFAKHILNLKGKYEDSLYFGSYDLSGMYKYYYEDSTLDYGNAKRFFEDPTSHIRENYIKKIKLHVCPRNFQNLKTDNMYMNSYLQAMIKKRYKIVNFDFIGFKENEIIQGKYRIKSVFHQNFHLVRNSPTLFEFIKFDGINYLSLLFEYYYQILIKIQNYSSEKDKKEIFDKMYNTLYNFLFRILNVNDLYQYIFVLFGEIKLSKFETELRKMFYLFSVLVSKVIILF